MDLETSYGGAGCGVYHSLSDSSIVFDMSSESFVVTVHCAGDHLEGCVILTERAALSREARLKHTCTVIACQQKGRTKTYIDFHGPRQRDGERERERS